MDINESIKKAETLEEIYTPDKIDRYLSAIGFGLPRVKTNKQIEYYNIPAAFDIETTSTYIGRAKCSIMYEWTLGINFKVMVGRTWEELKYVLRAVSNFLDLHGNKILIIYVHNLSFEFQAFRKRFEWKNVFSLDQRKPVYALTTSNIEFRCSYILSGYPLEKLGGTLLKYKVNKMVGDLDYSLVRHTKTPLTDKEIGYCVNDVLVVMAYIQEKIEREGDITKIPLTKTGYVRRACRNACYYDDKTHRVNTNKFHEYRKLMNKLTIEPEEYEMLQDAFMGGFTHANPIYSMGVFNDVKSYDFTSSYPAVMISEQFPMSKGFKVKLNSREQFDRYLSTKCCLFEVSFSNLKASTFNENYLSSSHCRNKKGCTENNGRIYKADYLETTITEQDFLIIKKFYTWSSMSIGRFYIYDKCYLPKSLVKAIFDFYVDKTSLKEVEGREFDYGIAKENVNSVYGMMVTDIVRDEIIYTEGIWDTKVPNLEESLLKYNRNMKRFLFYPWGVWVTAYARVNLFTGIYEFGDDYIYSDTDSLKVQNYDRHLSYIKNYNALITYKLKKAFKYHGFDEKDLEVKNKYGKIKLLGVWDDEGVYSRFKTLGAKRYLTEKDGVIKMTVAGLGKVKAMEYLNSLNTDVFELFNDGLKIPAEHTGKLTHTYIDDEMKGVITDYTGKVSTFHELSGTHLEPAPYDLSISQIYADFIAEVKQKIE